MDVAFTMTVLTTSLPGVWGSTREHYNYTDFRLHVANVWGGVMN